MTRRKHRLPMSDPMIRAIQREIEQPGTGKTQTRRIVKDVAKAIGLNAMGFSASPYGQSGDLLAFTETFAFGSGYDHLPPREVPSEPYIRCWYGADRHQGPSAHEFSVSRGRWRPARFMPYWCTRYTGVVTDVRVERVQDIGDEDAISEGATQREAGWCMDWSRVGQISRFAGGVHPPGKGQPITERDIALGSPRWAFAEYWEKLHGEGAWPRNDWVWVYTYRPIAANVLDVERDPAAYGLGGAA